MANIYDAAKVAYKYCVNDLTKMGNLAKDLMAKQGKEWSVRVLLNQFDVILQYSLLEYALADKTLSSEEVCFIRDLTDYCQLPEYLKALGYNNATWQGVYNTDEAKLSQILADIRGSVSKLSEDFINLFAAYDAAADHDYLEDLKYNLGVIFAATWQADGKVESRERSNSCLMIETLAHIKVLIDRL